MPCQCVRTCCGSWQHKGQDAVLKAESCHRYLNTLAVAVFTECYCGEAALVPLSSLHFVPVYLSLSHLPVLCLWSHSHIYLLNVCLSFVFVLPLTSLFRLSCLGAHGPVSPHMPSFLSSYPFFPFSPLSSLIFFSFSHSPCESHRRGAETEPGVNLMNEVVQAQPTLLCWVTIRPLSQSITLSLTPSLFHMHIQSRLSQISLSARFLLHRVTLTSRDSSELLQKHSHHIRPQLNFNHNQARPLLVGLSKHYVKMYSSYIIKFVNRNVM